LGKGLRVVCIDIGTKVCGFAVSDEMGVIATPVPPLKVGTGERLIERLADYAMSFKPQKIVVGLPLMPDGSIGERAKSVIRLCEKLSALVDVPVVLWDEAYSTEVAKEKLAHTKRPRKGFLDSASAAVILQDYLDRRGADGRDCSQGS
jgi:putative Holliday junction resolvase